MTSRKILVSSITAIVSLSVAFPAFAEESSVERRPRTRLENRLMKVQENGQFREDRMLQRESRMMNQDDETGVTERVRTRTSRSTSVDTGCISAAVDARDTAMMDAMDTMSTSLRSALSIRKSALMAAWSTTDAIERNTTMRSIWADFKKSTMDARSAMKTEKKSIWSTFKTSAKACNASEADAAGESSDSAL